MNEHVVAANRRRVVQKRPPVKPLTEGERMMGVPFSAEELLAAFNSGSVLSKHLMTLYSLAVGCSGRLMAEFGIGINTRVLLAAATATGGRLYSCDPDANYYGELRNLYPTTRRWRLSLTSPARVIASLPEPLDFVFHRGLSHNMNLSADIRAIIPKMRQFGLIAIHNTQHSERGGEVLQEVQEAVKDLPVTAVTLPFSSGLTLLRIEESAHPPIMPAGLRKGAKVLTEPFAIGRDLSPLGAGGNPNSPMPVHITPPIHRYLHLQRTTYGQLSLRNSAVRLDHEIEQFRRHVEPFLPRLGDGRKARILDIGCGIGTSLLALWRHYGDRGHYVALDKTEVASKVYYGFAEEGAAYNDMSLTKEFLVGSGMSAEQLSLVDINKSPFPESMGPFDIVMSTISWGFHYPVQAYLSEVLQSTKKGALLYIDLRQGTDGEDVLSQHFDLVSKVAIDKHLSTVWRRR